MIIAPTTFDIFEDSLLTKKYATIDMYQDEDKIDFCPVFFKPDYGIMQFVCIGENANAYKVLTGFSSYKFLPKKSGYEFKTWESYILDSFGIHRKSEIIPKGPMKEAPDDTANNVEIPDGFELLCPVEVKGDWVKVKYDCFYNIENNKYEGQPCNTYIDQCEDPLTGWVRWRKGNELLIDISLMA